MNDLASVYPPFGGCAISTNVQLLNQGREATVTKPMLNMTVDQAATLERLEADHKAARDAWNQCLKGKGTKADRRAAEAAAAKAAQAMTAFYKAEFNTIY